MVRIHERRWNLRLHSGTDVLLPEGHEANAIQRLGELLIAGIAPGGAHPRHQVTGGRVAQQTDQTRHLHLQGCWQGVDEAIESLHVQREDALALGGVGGQHAAQDAGRHAHHHAQPGKHDAADDAGDMVTAAPVDEKTQIRAKLAAVASLASSIAMVPLLLIAWANRPAAAIAVTGIVLAVATGILVNLWHQPVDGSRHRMRRRGAGAPGRTPARRTP